MYTCYQGGSWFLGCGQFCVIKRILDIKHMFPCSFGNKCMRLLTRVYGMSGWPGNEAIHMSLIKWTKTVAQAWTVDTRMAWEWGYQMPLFGGQVVGSVHELLPTNNVHRNVSIQNSRVCYWVWQCHFCRFTRVLSSCPSITVLLLYLWRWSVRTAGECLTFYPIVKSA